MVETFVGKFLLESSENFDEYMKKVGVNFALRKIAGLAKNTIIFSVDGPKITYKSESTVRNQTMTFELGKEFDETTQDGRQVKSTITIDGDGKMVQKQVSVDPAGMNSTITRSIQGDYLIAEIQCDDVKCTRKYKRIE